MANLVFQMMISLDGYINDTGGGFDWGHIDAEVHGHANREAGRCGMAVYGRRMYGVMAIWQTYEGNTPCEKEFAELWRKIPKLVVSKSLCEPKTPLTRVVHSLDAGSMRALKEQVRRDIFVSGPTLAATYLEAGLVDEIGIYHVPIIVGGGTPMFSPPTRLKLERTETHPFRNGVNFTRYRVLKDA